MTTRRQALGVPWALARVGIIACVGIVACGSDDAAVGGDTDGTTTATDTTDEGGTVVADSTDAASSEGDDGPIVVGDVVDCSTLPAGGPTVAGGELTAFGFPEYHCDPSAAPSDPSNTEYACCSTDPAAVTGIVPDYEGKNIEPSGEPYFSGNANPVGQWGACVRTSDIPTGSGLLEAAAMNCPIPCNPTWETADIDAVCGTSRVCCQVHALQPEDCVGDPLRPVTGADIGTLTTWAVGEHATHQDPGLPACTAAAGGDTESMLYLDCIAQLSVANQRGYCMALGPGVACPTEPPPC